MGRNTHTKSTRIKAIGATLAVALAGAITGSALVLAGGNAQAATDTSKCPTGQQAVESLVPLRGEGETICLPTSENADEGSRVDVNFSRAASEVIREGAPMIDGAEQREATVVCWSVEDWRQIGDWFAAHDDEDMFKAFGFVWTPSNVINLSPRLCRTIDAIVYGGERPDTMIASNAIGVIAHEAIHVAGIVPEGETECYAMQLTQRAAAELGLDETYGASLVELNWDFNHGPRAGSIYDSPDCHDGGLFDLDNDTLWH